MDVLGDSFFVDTYEQVARAWGKQDQKRKIVMDFCFIAGQNEI